MEQGWSRDTLTVQIKNRAHERHGAAVTNFATTLPAPHADLAQQLLIALRDIGKPIGVADYELTRALPQELASSLPSIEDIEAEFSQSTRREI